MQDNAVGKLIKLAIVGWTLICGWSCFSAMSGIDRAGSNDVPMVRVLWISAVNGAFWFFPTVGGYLLYQMFGRSEPRERTELDRLGPDWWDRVGGGLGMAVFYLIVTTLVVILVYKIVGRFSGP